MKVSEITIDILKQYLRIDGNDDDVLVEAMLSASIDYAVSYTGLSVAELDVYSDVPIAIMAICADMYDTRTFTTNGIQLNPTATQILGSHCQNLL